jgi:hypothetical protein
MRAKLNMTDRALTVRDVAAEYGVTTATDD